MQTHANWICLAASTVFVIVPAGADAQAGIGEIRFIQHIEELGAVVNPYNLRRDKRALRPRNGSKPKSDGPSNTPAIISPTT